MSRALLLVVTLVVAGLLLADAAARWRRSSQTAPVSALALTRDTSPARANPAQTTRDRDAILRRIQGEGDRTYFDSLLPATDSIVRRWTAAPGRALTVAFVPGPPESGYSPHAEEIAREACFRWADQGAGLRFAVTPDSGRADIVVRWIDRFQAEHGGQTDLRWAGQGAIQRAHVSLAAKDAAGHAFDDQLLMVAALHEMGHALGLPHSGDSADVMFPRAMVPQISARDQRTLVLLYSLPAGSVRSAQR